MDESIVTVNLQINDRTNEIEYIKMENAENNSSDGEETEGEQIDEENVLVPKSDGVMTIKMKKKTVLEHVCAKCNKSYKTLLVSWITKYKIRFLLTTFLTQGLKRHLNLCRNMPKDQSVKLKQEASLEDIDFSAVDEDTCFCCLESKETAHVSTKTMIELFDWLEDKLKY